MSDFSFSGAVSGVFATLIPEKGERRRRTENPKLHLAHTVFPFSSAGK